MHIVHFILYIVHFVLHFNLHLMNILFISCILFNISCIVLFYMLFNIFCILYWITWYNFFSIFIHVLEHITLNFILQVVSFALASYVYCRILCILHCICFALICINSILSIMPIIHIIDTFCLSCCKLFADCFVCYAYCFNAYYAATLCILFVYCAYRISNYLQFVFDSMQIVHILCSQYMHNLCYMYCACTQYLHILCYPICIC